MSEGRDWSNHRCSCGFDHGDHCDLIAALEAQELAIHTLQRHYDNLHDQRHTEARKVDVLRLALHTERQDHAATRAHVVQMDEWRARDRAEREALQASTTTAWDAACSAVKLLTFVLEDRKKSS